MDDSQAMDDSRDMDDGQALDDSPTSAESDWTLAVWTLRREVRAYPRKGRSASGHSSLSYVLEDTLQTNFYEVGRPEYLLASNLDGRRTVAKALACIPAADRPSPEQAQQIVQWLLSSQLIKLTGAAHGARLHQLRQASQRRETWQRYNPLTARLPLTHPDRWLAKCAEHFRWLSSPWVTIALMALIACAASHVVSQVPRLQEAARGVLSPQRWLWIAVCWLALKVIHEGAHGIVCRIYGGNVREAGVMLLYFFPVAYVDVTSSWRFRSKWQRIHTAAAGMQVELMIAAIAAIVWASTSVGVLNDVCFNLMVAASITTLLFNANPLMRFDGYYILSDWLGIPNLYSAAQQHVVGKVKQWFLGLPPINAPSAGPPWLLAGYGAAVLMWRVVVVAGIVLMLSQLFSGAGLVLASLVAVTWLATPIAKFWRYMRHSPEVTSAARRRGAVGAAVLVSAALFVLALPFAPRYVAPALVEYSSLCVVRAGEAGFVDELWVDDGDWVEAGQPLLRMLNRELTSELGQRQRQVQAAEVEVRQHQQAGDLAACQAALRRLDASREQLAEIEKQCESQVVTAPVAGQILRRDLRDDMGRFHQAGDELLAIGDHDAKELRVSIDQRQMDGLEQANAQVYVRIPGHRPFRAPLTVVEPLASLKPLHVSLCATAGGPLPVVMQDGEPQLIQPRFTALIALPPQLARQVRAGRRASAVIELQRKSLWQYLRTQFTEWVSARTL